MMKRRTLFKKLSTLSFPQSILTSLVITLITLTFMMFTPSMVNAQERVTDGQQVLYTFHEGSGTVVNDVSGVGIPLNLTIAEESVISWLPISGLSINSPTIIDSTVAATKVIDACMVTNEITIEAWVKPANTSQDGPARIVTLSKDIYNRNFTLAQGLWDDKPTDVYDARLRTTTTDSNGRPSLTSPVGSLTTDLTHVVYTRNSSSTATIYIDGSADTNKTVGGNFSNWKDSYLLALGNELTNDRPWLGELHLVAIFDRALTQAEIKQNFAAGPPAVPDKPTELLAIADSASQITLTWKDNADNETNFEIERSTSGNGGPFIFLNIVPANTTEYSDMGLIPDTKYCYRVRAINTMSNSDYSHVDCSITLASNPPPPPTHFQVFISPDSATVTSGKTLELSAVTKRNGIEVPGVYVWSIVPESMGGTIDDSGVYTAGDTCTEVIDTIKATDLKHWNFTDHSFITVEPRMCEVKISPDSATVKSGETLEFNAITTCDGNEVAGTFQWEILSTIESTIDEHTGAYTAGTTGSETIDTIRVTDTAHCNVTATVEVIAKSKVTPVPCEITVDPSSALLDSGEGITLTATSGGEGCLEPEYTWRIDTDIHSKIITGGSECFYRAGTNKTGMLFTDTITVIDKANGISADATLTVHYGRIVRVFPKTLFASRWLYLPKIIVILGEDTDFNGTSYPTFSPDSSIITLGKIGIGNLMLAVVFLPPDMEGGAINLAVTTTNKAGQTAVFPMEDALNIKLLPLMMDE